MRHLYQKTVTGPNPAEVDLHPTTEDGELSETALLTAGLAECKKITKKYGTSFYFATQFFPREVRLGIYAIYAFARIPDEIVDDPQNEDLVACTRALGEWRQSWRRAMRLRRSDDPIMAAIVFTFEKYDIPVREGEAFLDSMFMDLKKKTYQDYNELENYMYGSAAVIGLMVTRIVGFHTEEAFPYAEKLGYAFQLTNFLRDIKEDAEGLGRIYMPQNELERFNLSPQAIENNYFNDNFVRFMKFQIERNREVYREALPGIKLLKWRGRLAVRISYVLYKEILAEIERAEYNVYQGRVRTNFSQKVWLSLKALFGVYE